MLKVIVTGVVASLLTWTLSTYFHKSDVVFSETDVQTFKVQDPDSGKNGIAVTAIIRNIGETEAIEVKFKEYKVVIQDENTTTSLNWNHEIVHNLQPDSVATFGTSFIFENEFPSSSTAKKR